METKQLGKRGLLVPPSAIRLRLMALQAQGGVCTPSERRVRQAIARLLR